MLGAKAVCLKPVMPSNFVQTVHAVLGPDKRNQDGQSAVWYRACATDALKTKSPGISTEAKDPLN